MTFLSPLFLIGLVAAAIPLIIHLSRSRRQKKLRFSTSRFLTEQFIRSYRMSRIKEIWLLLCRMALCALFAVALAGPLLLPRGTSFLSGGGSRAVVIVLDNSASMAAREDGVTMLERARQAARELLGGLRSGDTATIILAARRAGGPEVLFPEPTPDLGDVLQALNGVEPATLGTDLTQAVAHAQQLALNSAAASKEVYVLSDLQDSGWELPDEKSGLKATSDVVFFFVQVRPRRPVNVGVTAVQYAAARPMVGVPFSFKPHLAVHGELDRPIEVRLFVDGQKVAERSVERLPSGGMVVPRFHHIFTTGGWHSGYIEVDDDAFPLDNRRYFAVEVLDTLKVLAVNGAPSQVPRLDELFFFRLALTADPSPQPPSPAAGERGRGEGAGHSPIQLDETSPAELAGKDLTRYPLVVLANVESLSTQALEKVEKFVDGGGSLLVFLGDKVNAAYYNEYLTAATRLHGGLLPGKLLELQTDPKGGEECAGVGAVDYDHPALSAFQDQRFVTLAGVQFKALWKVDPGSSALLMRQQRFASPVRAAFRQGASASLRQHLRPRLDQLPGAAGVPAVGASPDRLPGPGTAPQHALLQHRRRHPHRRRRSGFPA